MRLWRSLFVLLIIVFLLPAVEAQPFKISADIHRTDSTPFIPHTESKPYGSYLAMNLPFEPIEALRKELERRESVSLAHRGEAHITVITPPEFDKHFKG